MSEEEIRIAVAELCGWTKLIPGDEMYPHLSGFSPGSSQVSLPPDYTQSLDACAEMEATLNTFQLADYKFKLTQLHRISSDAILSTPLQRCEAFLRLHGKWVEATPAHPSSQTDHPAATADNSGGQ